MYTVFNFNNLILKLYYIQHVICLKSFFVCDDLPFLSKLTDVFNTLFCAIRSRDESRRMKV